MGIGVSFLPLPFLEESINSETRIFHVVYYHVCAVLIAHDLANRVLPAHSWAPRRTLFSEVGSIIISIRPEVGTSFRTQKRSETYLIY